MVAIDEKLRDRIANCGLVCALLVVFIHVDWHVQGSALSAFIWRYVANGLSRAAVPLFFAIAGFLMAGHCNEHGWWWKEVKKRIRSLLIPFAVWNGLAVILSVGVKIAHGQGLAGMDWLTKIGLDLSWTPCLTPLWFVRALFILVLLSPVLSWMLAKAHIGTLLVLYALLLLHECRAMDCFGLTFVYALYYGVPLQGLFYFALGMWVRSAGIRSLPCWAVVLLWIGGAICVQYEMTSVSSLLLATALFSTCPALHWPSVITGLSFPIFCLHHLFVFLLAPAMPAVPFGMGVRDVVVCLGAVFGSAACAYGLCCLFPRLAKFAFGGRGIRFNRLSGSVHAT